MNLNVQQGMDSAPAFSEFSPNLGGILFNFGYTFVILWYATTAVLQCSWRQKHHRIMMMMHTCLASILIRNFPEDPSCYGSWQSLSCVVIALQWQGDRGHRQWHHH
jgi:hypothetical protein